MSVSVANLDTLCKTLTGWLGPREAVEGISHDWAAKQNKQGSVKVCFPSGNSVSISYL